MPTLELSACGRLIYQGEEEGVDHGDHVEREKEDAPNSQSSGLAVWLSHLGSAVIRYRDGQARPQCRRDLGR